ncbi:DNA repair protein (plasmid) [Acinetobacter baumannii]|uniref:DNA repair protein n=1 Tax=Acinetobacter baumannii TaxID=470 RepID=UPI003891F5E9
MDNKEEMKTAPQAENAIDRNDEIIFDELLSQVDPIKSISPPDTTLKSSDLEAYGYQSQVMLPVSESRAKELFEKVDLYRLYEDGTEALLEDLADLSNHAKQDGLFGVQENDWRNYLLKIDKSNDSENINDIENFQYFSYPALAQSIIKREGDEFFANYEQTRNLGSEEEKLILNKEFYTEHKADLDILLNELTISEQYEHQGYAVLYASKNRLAALNSDEEIEAEANEIKLFLEGNNDDPKYAYVYDTIYKMSTDNVFNEFKALEAKFERDQVLEEGNFNLPFQHVVDETMDTFDNNSPISNLPFDSYKEPEGFMDGIDQYPHAESQDFSNTNNVNFEELDNKSEKLAKEDEPQVKELNEVQENIIINGKEFNYEQLDPNDIEKHEQLRAALAQLLGNTNAASFQNPSQINPVISTPLVRPQLPDINESSAQPSTVKNYSLFPSFANLKKATPENALSLLQAEQVLQTSQNLNAAENATPSMNTENIQHMLSSHLASSKYNDLVKSHKNYSDSINEFWKFDKFEDFRGTLIERGQKENKDLKTLINEMNTDPNSPYRKEFQDLIVNVGSTEKGKALLSKLNNSHQDFLSRSDSMFEVIQKSELSPDDKTKFENKLSEVVENQAELSSTLPNYINDDGVRISLADEMKKYAESLKKALQVVVDFVKSKVGLSVDGPTQQSSSSPSP